MKKVLLVSLNSKYIHTNLALQYLKAFTGEYVNQNEKDLTLEILELTINDQIEMNIRKILELEPDFIGFSTYIWNVEYIEKIENTINLIDKNINFFYGGPEVSFDSENFLKTHKGKYLITGDGEKPFKEFLKYINGETKIQNIKNIYYKDKDENIIFNGEDKLLDMNEIIFPYKDYEFDNRIVYYESSRGCPFNCSYCLSSVIKGLRFLEIERVKSEIDFFIEKKVGLVKFVDRTFNANPNFAREVWQYIIEKDSNTTFHFEVAGDIIDKDTLSILKKAKKNQIQLEIGIQTTNEEVIKNVNRSTNTKKLLDNIKKIVSFKNINTHVDLIAGLPGENLESFKNSFDEVYKTKANEIQLGFLKIIKGSLIEKDKEKFSIIHASYPPYEVLKTKDISYKDIDELKKVETLVDKYYNSKRFKNSLKYLMIKYKSAYEFFKDLAIYFEQNKYYYRNISQIDYYKILIEFNDQNINHSSPKEMLIELIKYDYLKYNKKRFLPEFMNRNLDSSKEKALRIEFLNEGILEKNSKTHIEFYLYDVQLFEEEGSIIEVNNIIIYDSESMNFKKVYRNCFI